MYKLINCECGTTCSKSSYNRHLKSQKHISFVGSNSNKKEPEDCETNEEPDTQEEEDFKALALAKGERRQGQEEEDYEEREEEEEEEVVDCQEPASQQKTRSNNNKHHLDAIREKAIMKLKEKKQIRINKELEIRQKAEQYDILVKSLKEKEEIEKKQKEQEKIKEMEYKSSQYDKMVKQQQRNTAITSLSNEKIINDIKEQRINYLMKYLQNPNIY